MPIDRPDGRHWCAPDNETPDEHKMWTCECGKTWEQTEEHLGWVWVLAEDQGGR